jgi:hypothetical protein
MSAGEPPTPLPSAAVLAIVAELAKVRAALRANAEVLEAVERKLRTFSVAKAL